MPAALELGDEDGTVSQSPGGAHLTPGRGRRPDSALMAQASGVQPKGVGCCRQRSVREPPPVSSALGSDPARRAVSQVSRSVRDGDSRARHLCLPPRVPGNAWPRGPPSGSHPAARPAAPPPITPTEKRRGRPIFTAQSWRFRQSGTKTSSQHGDAATVTQRPGYGCSVMGAGVAAVAAQVAQSRRRVPGSRPVQTLSGAGRRS